MPKIWVSSFILALLLVPALGESKGAGFFYSGGGAVTDGNAANGFLQLGGGGEALLQGGLGLGAEVGYLSPPESFGSGLGIFSPGVFYAFGPNRKWSPFLTGGYSLLFRSGTMNGFHVGAGVQRWVGKNWGLRLEVRDQVMPQYEGVHFLVGRVGLTLR